MSFTKWLVRQRKRDDLAGDLARGVAADPSWPTAGGFTICSRYLRRVHAVRAMRVALFMAWREYRKAHGTSVTLRGSQTAVR